MHQLDNLANRLCENLREKPQQARTERKSIMPDIEPNTVCLILTLAAGGLGIFLFKAFLPRNWLRIAINAKISDSVFNLLLFYQNDTSYSQRQITSFGFCLFLGSKKVVLWQILVSVRVSKVLVEMFFLSALNDFNQYKYWRSIPLSLLVLDVLWNAKVYLIKCNAWQVPDYSAFRNDNG